MSVSLSPPIQFFWPITVERWLYALYIFIVFLCIPLVQFAWAVMSVILKHRIQLNKSSFMLARSYYCDSTDEDEFFSLLSNKKWCAKANDIRPPNSRYSSHAIWSHVEPRIVFRKWKSQRAALYDKKMKRLKGTCSNNMLLIGNFSVCMKFTESVFKFNSSRALFSM